MVLGGRIERSVVGGFGGVNGYPSLPNLLSRQNKNQPEREILENGENLEIRKIRKNKQKCTKPEFLQDPAKRNESQKKNRGQTRSTRQDPCPHAPELKPSSFRIRSLASYPRPVLCQRNPLPIQIPPTYSHSRHPTGDHSSQETGT